MHMNTLLSMGMEVLRIFSWGEAFIHEATSQGTQSSTDTSRKEKERKEKRTCLSNALGVNGIMKSGDEGR